MANMNLPGAMASEKKTRAGRTRTKTLTQDEAPHREASDVPPPPRLLIHSGRPAEGAVVRLLRAAARIGMDATCAPPLNGAGAAGGAGFQIVVLHHAEGPESVAVMRLRTAYPGCRLVVLGSEPGMTDVERLFSAGASGYVPPSFSEEAMAAALQLIRSGEIFSPRQAGTPEAQVRKVQGTDVGMRDFGLTKVEREVLALAAQGLTNLEISLRRGGVEGTVKVHMNHIFSKLNVRSRCEAIAVYLQTHNVDPEELRRAQSGDMDMKWLLATMTHEHHLKGTVLFRRGQQGDRIYYLQNGIVRLKEIEVDMHPRDLFGEIGVFAPEHKRTCTAVCSTDVDLFSLSFEEVRRCYFLNPQFAFYVMYLITRRLMADRERFQDSIR